MEMDLPRREVLESNYLQLGDGNVIAVREVGEGALGMETVDALPVAVVQSEEATMTEEDIISDGVQNYTQHVNVSDAVSADALNHALHANVSDDLRPDSQNYHISTTMSNRSDDTSYDCSIVWVRVPKTASTTILKTFMEPLASWFQNTHIGPNTCISQPGGCSLHWNSSLGGSSNNNESNINAETACIGASKGECFEYDNTTKTTNFGPSGEVSDIVRKNLLKIGQGKKDLRSQFEDDNVVVKQRAADDGNSGVFSPSVNAHVGLHTSLINNVLPPKPMVFSAFREPKERLLSSFHHGIVYGAGKPGQVKNCNPNKAGWKGPWRERVATARRMATESNNTMHYQTLLRHYLEQCKDATWNMYTQFLDPATKDVNVALHNLEEYVIVGLQTNITETLQLWANTMKKSCRHRPDYDQMGATILFKPFNETQEEKREKVSISVKHLVVLKPPNVSEFDDDLKDLFNAYIKEDEIIYQRAKELHAKQREMILN